jgi:hypothetical protein
VSSATEANVFNQEKTVCFRCRKNPCECEYRAEPPFAAARGSAASNLDHTCCVCGHHWKSVDAETAKDVIQAIKANKQGPYCALCLHLEMAERYANLRGYCSLQEAVSDWVIAKAKQQNIRL